MTPGDAAGGDRETVVVSWSTGKDAAVVLADLAARDDVVVAELLTTVRADNDRVSMHGVPRALAERQAEAVGVPVRVVELPADASDDEYEAVMADVHAEYADRGVDRVAFADLHLEDVRAYRERQLSDAGVDGWWPVWGRDTRAFARAFVERGFRATVTCVDGSALDASFVGREYDDALLADLPDGVDPCGERGEFHTFARAGPPFRESVAVEVAGTVTRDVQGTDFHYADLRPA